MKLFNKKNIYYFSVVIIINIAFLFLPLVNVIGYEHSAVNAVLLFLVSGIFITIKYPNAKIDKIPFVEIVKDNFLFYLLLFFIPLIIGVLNTLLTNCPLDDSILFYLLVSLPALFIGFSISYFIKINISKYATVLFLFVFVLFALISFLEFYFYDQIFIYNPIVGFVSGTIYDEYIPIPQKLILAQLIFFKLFLGFVIVKQKIKSFAGFTKIIFNTTLVLSILLVYLIKPELGLVTNNTTLKSELPIILENENFLIYLPENISEKRRKIIQLEHEYYFNELKSIFNFKPKNKIRSIIFRDSQQKDKLFGSANANVAKIWSNTIYQTIDSYSHTLHHEMIHIFSGEIGKGLLKLPDNSNFYLLEGLAMALENNFDNKPVHYAAALVIKNNKINNIDFINQGTTFFLANVNQSYSIAGSFVKYLIDTYGIKSFIEIYQNTDYLKYYSKEFNELSKEYLSFINTINIDFIKNEYQRYFSAQPLLKKNCARYIAKLNYKSNTSINNQQYLKATILNQEIFNKTNSINSLSRLLFCYDKMYDYKKAINLIELNYNLFKDELSKNILIFNKADFLIKSNNINQAIELYNQIELQSLPNNYKNIVLIRMALIDAPHLLKNYVIGSNYDKFQILKEINLKKELYNVTFNSILQLANALNVAPNEVLEYYKNIINENKNVEHSVMFELAQYSLENNLIESAIYFSEKSLLNLDNEMKKIIFTKNYEKIKWINKALNENK